MSQNHSQRPLARVAIAVGAAAVAVGTLVAGGVAANAAPPAAAARGGHGGHGGPSIEQVSPGKGFRTFGEFRVTTGTQTYTCEATSTWSAASVPKATLAGRGTTLDHFGGPRWKAPDGSTVVGSVVTRVPVTGTIPWLLLSVSAHEGPAGLLSPVTHISRIKTSGGTAPAGACTAGTTVAVPYKAEYVLWVPTRKR